MPISCRLKAAQGSDFCTDGCPVQDCPSALEYVRIERPPDVPAPDARSVDVAVLDMNHGWPNLGHDSLVHAVQDAACDVLPALEASGLRVRVLSFDVRRGGVVPAPPPRYSLYVGTGGPGHLDPHLNDGTSEGSQGLVEDPSWEEPVFALFDAILRSPGSALLSVCHSFGVMCRWSGVADAVLRPASKGGKSAGIMENVLTPEGQRHPWFARLAEELPEHRRLRVVDHRLFDLIPGAGSSSRPAGRAFLPIGYETLGPGGPPGDALTMMEFARDERGVVPRVFGVNHHPEIVDRSRQRMILEQKRERGEVTEEWYLDRRRLLNQYPDDSTDQRLHLTSDFTLLAPLRYFLYRALRQRAQSLGLRLDVDEAAALEWDRRAETRR
jgi:hypothetical protein